MKKFYILSLAIILCVAKLSAQTINEGFESGTFPPTGWSVSSPDGGSGWADTVVGITPVPGFQGGVVTACNNGGSNVAFCSWATGGATTNNQWLITKQISNVTANYSVNFWMRKFGGYIDNLKVLVSTSGNQVANFTNTLATVNFVAADSGWVNYNYNLGSYAGQTIYIAFNEYVADNQVDGAFFSLDNVVVGPSSSINDLNSQVYTNVYPVPAKNFLNLEASNVINNIKVINMVGKVVFEKGIETKFYSLNTSELQSGIYFIQMNFKEGSVTKRFVIE